ncbi:TPA: FtsQ-type POTRA domain-containing protein [bacterium]|nr:FtsQ-type POTRA domain-containing protein [bacterium]
MKNNRKKEEKPINNFFIFILWLLVIVLSSLTIFIIEIGKKNLIQSSFLVLKDIKIYGNSIVSSSDICELSGLGIGNDYLYSFMPHVIEKRIKSQSSYVKDAKVKKDLLKGQLIVTINERKPVAIISKSMDAKNFKVVDIDGYILNELTDKDIALSCYKKLPFIFEDSDKSIDWEFLDNNSYISSVSGNLGLKVLSEIKALGSGFLLDLTYIDTRNSDDIVLHLLGGTNIRISCDRIKEGLFDVKNLMYSYEFRNINSKIKYIDARFSKAIYCG